MVNLEKEEMTFESFQDFFPLADELLVYFEETVDDTHKINAS
jgi:hypothetical protein